MNTGVTLTIGTASIDQNLGFLAQSVTVNNHTNQWVKVAGATYVPPYYIGAVVSLNGTQQGAIAFEAPPGFTQPPTIAGQQVFSSWDSASAAGSVGQYAGPTQANVTNVKLSPGLTILANATTTGNVNFTLPSGTLALALIPYDNLDNVSTAYNLTPTVQDKVTGYKWPVYPTLPAGDFNKTAPFVVNLNDTESPIVTISVSAQASIGTDRHIDVLVVVQNRYVMSIDKVLSEVFIGGVDPINGTPSAANNPILAAGLDRINSLVKVPNVSANYVPVAADPSMAVALSPNSAAINIAGINTAVTLAAGTAQIGHVLIDNTVGLAAGINNIGAVEVLRAGSGNSITHPFYVQTGDGAGNVAGLLAWQGVQYSPVYNIERYCDDFASNYPGVANVPTVTIAGVSGQKHVIRYGHFSAAENAAAAFQDQAVIKDGGAVLWTGALAVTNQAQGGPLEANCKAIGSTNTNIIITVSGTAANIIQAVAIGTNRL